MRNRILQKYILVVFVYLLGWVFSQSNSIYYHNNPGPVMEGDDILISQTLFTSDPIHSGVLYYRPNDALSYIEVPMEFRNGSWHGIIPGNQVTLQGLEYVTVITKMNGGRIGLPMVENPFDSPLEIVVTKKPTLNTSSNSFNRLVSDETIDEENDYVEADILILSPEEGGIVNPGEVVISVSLFNAPTIDQTDYILLLDGKDVTDQSILEGEVLSMVPSNIGVGHHTIKLQFKTTFGIDVYPLIWSFNVSKGISDIANSFTYKGSLSAVNSSNTASSITIDEKLYSGKFDGELSWIKGRYSFRNSSRDNIYSQALNRSTLSLQVTDYLKIDNGDIYPSISPYLLDGKRVKGRHTHADFNYDFDLWNWEIYGSFEIQTVFGEFAREVQYQKGVNGAYEVILSDTDFDSTSKTYKIGRLGYTFPQDVIATRIGFSFLNKYNGGIHFLRAKDDYEKIKTIPTFNSTFEIDTSITGDSISHYYTLPQFLDSLNTMGDTLFIKEKNWQDGNPKENIVLGFDFETALDNRKLLFQLGWNMSLTNSNIWGGLATEDSLDLMLDTLEDGKIMEQYDIEGIGNMIKNFGDYFTIHPMYMSPIAPIDPIAYEENKFRAILNMPSAAYYLRLKGSYSLNNILVEYKQLGSEYQSFGNPYLTNNIREFIINDRLSLLGRRLMFVVGYKYRDNNLSETVVNPIKTKTMSFNTTLVPGPGAPSIVFNFQSINRHNGIDSVDTDQYGNQIGDSREDSRALNMMGSVNIPGNFGKLNTTTSINFNSIKYTDNLASTRLEDYLFSKTESQTYSVAISARFDSPLRMSASFNQTELFMPSLDTAGIPIINTSKWMSVTNTIQYSFLKNKVRLSGGLDFMTNGETGESATRLYGSKFNCDWDIIHQLTMSLNSSIRLNNIGSYLSDEVDNDGDGEVDEPFENYKMNTSGFSLSLGYRF